MHPLPIETIVSEVEAAQLAYTIDPNESNYQRCVAAMNALRDYMGWAKREMGQAE